MLLAKKKKCLHPSQNGGSFVLASGIATTRSPPTIPYVHVGDFFFLMASSAKKRAVGLGENPEDSDNSSDDNLEEDDGSDGEDSEDSEEDINEVKTQRNYR